MATIAVVPSQVSSKRRLASALAHRLEIAGHRVLSIDRSEGIDAAHLPQRVLDLRPPLTAVPAGPRLLVEPRARRAAARLDPRPLVELLGREHVELLLVDIEEHEYTMAALAAGVDIPIAVLSGFFELWPSAGVPPLDSPLGPDAGLLRIGGSWLRSWAGSSRRELRRRMQRPELDRSAVVRTCARHLGVRGHFTTRQWLQPFAPRAIPVLSATAEELDLPHDPPQNVLRIGPLLDVTVADVAGDDAVMVGRADEARRRGRPVVVCAFGGFASAGGPFLARLGEVARLQPGTEFIVAVGDDDPGPLASLPNVVTARWIPQRALLERCDAAIVHSGTGTLHECVAAGAPVVVYPLPLNDQAGNAVRVTHHGLGEVGDREADDAPTLAARLDRVMADRLLRRRVEALGERLRRYERDRVAVATVEGLIAR